MTLVRTTLAAIVTTVCACGAAQVNAAGYEHIDQLALQLQQQSRELYAEFKTHYSHATHTAHLRSDAARLYHLAGHIHEVAHVRGSLRHIESDLATIDSRFHHLEGLVEHIDDDSFFSDGHVHGDTDHVRELMHSIEDTIHHLKADVREMRLNQQPVIIRPQGGHGHSYDDHGYDDHGHNNGGRVQGNGGGIQFGNGGIEIKF